MLHGPVGLKLHIWERDPESCPVLKELLVVKVHCCQVAFQGWSLFFPSRTSEELFDTVGHSSDGGGKKHIRDMKT